MLPAKFALRLSGKNGTPPFTAFSSIDASAYGQLTSSAAFPCSNASRAVPASVRVTEGSAPGAVATDFMICNALTVAVRCAGVSVRVTVLPSSESTWPPALSSSVLNQTTTPSFWLACTPIQLGPPAACNRAASSSTALHVSGGLFIKSGRYQSNWVLVLTGAAYNRCCQVAVLNGPGKVSVVASASARPAGSSDSGSPQPASANSAVQITSIAITSTVWSLALSRRANWTRWSSVARGRLTCRTVNRPPNWSVQRWATAVNVVASPAGGEKLITRPPSRATQE